MTVSVVPAPLDCGPLRHCFLTPFSHKEFFRAAVLTEAQRSTEGTEEMQKPIETIKKWLLLSEQLDVGFSDLAISPCRRGPPCRRENGCWLFLSAPPREKRLLAFSLVPASQDCVNDSVFQRPFLG